MDRNDVLKFIETCVDDENGVSDATRACLLTLSQQDMACATILNKLKVTDDRWYYANVDPVPVSERGL